MSVEDELTPQFTPIDYLLGVKPKYVEYCSLQKRIDSFDVEIWRQQPISRLDSSLLKPESFASAGFLYSGTADNVVCFCCGLGLNHWEGSDDPITEHVRFTPQCTWSLRKLGRQRVKYLYMKSQSLQAGSATLTNMKLADYSFIRDVQEIAGAGGGDWLVSGYSTFVLFTLKLQFTNDLAEKIK